MGEVVSFAAARLARFKGSNQKPLYDEATDALALMELRRIARSVDLQEWFDGLPPPDGGKAA